MIRFACPGCSSTFTVDDEKAGKTGKCPKCQAQFVIPAVESGMVPTPPAEVPPPLPGGSAPVEIDPCPKCQTRLSVGAGDVGLDVECPYCKTVFKATRGGGRPPAPPPLPDGTDRPSRRRPDYDDEDDDRPRSRRRPDDDEDDDEGRPSRRRRRDDDEEDEGTRPSRRRRRSRQHGEESKRTVAGILAILLGWCGVHKFYLGYTNAGLIMILIFCCTGLSGVIGLVEGIIYLTKSDEEFVETYQHGQKEWF